MIGFQMQMQVGMDVEMFYNVVVGYCWFVYWMYCYMGMFGWVMVDWFFYCVIGGYMIDCYCFVFMGDFV